MACRSDTRSAEDRPACHSPATREKVTIHAPVAERRQVKARHGSAGRSQRWNGGVPPEQFCIREAGTGRALLQLCRQRLQRVSALASGVRTLHHHENCARGLKASAFPHGLPTPRYWNPMARRREESSRFLVSMMMGRFSRWRILVKSRVRNSGHPVARTRASTPSATP
jgi:hypothetical protein